MVCDGCSSRVEEALAKMPGVKAVKVDLDKGVATVQLEAASQIDAFNGGWVGGWGWWVGRRASERASKIALARSDGPLSPPSHACPGGRDPGAGI